jgi:hypothetical protein
MKILRRHCRPLLISIACGLVLVRSQATWAQQARANKDSQSNADSAPSAIEKLAKMLIGNWDVVATIEPSASRNAERTPAPIESFGSGRTLCHRKLLHRRRLRFSIRTPNSLAGPQRARVSNPVL